MKAVIMFFAKDRSHICIAFFLFGFFIYCAILGLIQIIINFNIIIFLLTILIILFIFFIIFIIGMLKRLFHYLIGRKYNYTNRKKEVI